VKGVVATNLLVNGQIFPAATAEQGAVNFGHVLEEPLDVRPLAAKLALFAHLSGFDPAGVVQFHPLRVRGRQVGDAAAAVEAAERCAAVVSSVAVVLDVVVAVGRRAEREVVVVTSVLTRLLLLLLLLMLLLLLLLL